MNNLQVKLIKNLKKPPKNNNLLPKNTKLLEKPKSSRNNKSQQRSSRNKNNINQFKKLKRNQSQLKKKKKTCKFLLLNFILESAHSKHFTSKFWSLSHQPTVVILPKSCQLSTTESDNNYKQLLQRFWSQSWLVWKNGFKENKRDWEKKSKQLRNVCKILKNHLNQLRLSLLMRFKSNLDPSDNVLDKSKQLLPVMVLFWQDLKEFIKKLLKRKRKKKSRRLRKTTITNKNKNWI